MAETSVIYRKGSAVRVAHTAAERVQLEWEGFVLDPSTPATQPVEQASATPTPDLPVEPSETKDDFGYRDSSFVDSYTVDSDN